MANQTAVGLKKAELIERLTAENIVTHMFDALAAGAVQTAESKAADARCDLNRPHVFIHAERAPSSARRGALAGAGRARAEPAPAGSTRAPSSTLATTPCAGWRRCPTDDPGAAEALRQACDELAREEGLEIGLSDVDRGAAGAGRRMREAADAASIGRSLAVDGGAVSYEQLGAYRYLVHLELDEAPHDRYGQAVDALIEYDQRRDAQLVETLERFLGSRCSVAESARSAVHPSQHRPSATRTDRARDGARPAQRGLAFARARAQGGAAAPRAGMLIRAHPAEPGACGLAASCRGGRARARP